MVQQLDLQVYTENSICFALNQMLLLGGMFLVLVYILVFQNHCAVHLTEIVRA